MESFSHLATTFYIAANKVSRKYTMSQKTVHFYRATRMHSADYAVARRPSVRPSVCHTRY